MMLASRISLIKPSPTLAITAKANAMKAEGRDVIGFGAGEPDFDTPDNIKQAAIKAIQDGFTKYTPVGGTDELKDAIIEKFKTDNGLTYNRGEIVVSCGAKHSLYNLAQILFEEGDEVLIVSPYWVSYPDIVTLTGGTPVILTTKEEDGFKLRPDQLQAAINKKTKAIIFNSPSNPSGTMYTAEELKALCEIILKTGILVISDDIYEKIIYGDVPFFALPSICPEIKSQAVIVNGVSKAYAMTGWRIGYAAGPGEIIAAVSKIQSQNTSNPTSIAQKASVEAIRGDQSKVGEMVATFKERRDYIVRALNNIPDMSCLNPDGAFYVFPDFSRYYGRVYNGKEIKNSSDMSDFLLDEVNVAVVPGGEFGHDKNIRLSYATSMKNIEEGVRRIADALTRLK
ncbi:MAG: pyridoxal phosphate-dependent aminotransferase [Syntrophobacterales bacterium]|jgi:aspartate aminotransferase|nr:pyridoxal phosphate-dependent aminotransferase [Syntrophobacterales bacterium]